jgi:hypothetical protein
LFDLCPFEKPGSGGTAKPPGDPEQKGCGHQKIEAINQ